MFCQKLEFHNKITRLVDYNNNRITFIIKCYWVYIYCLGTNNLNVSYHSWAYDYWWLSINLASELVQMQLTIEFFLEQRNCQQYEVNYPININRILEIKERAFLTARQSLLNYITITVNMTNVIQCITLCIACASINIEYNCLRLIHVTHCCLKNSRNLSVEIFHESISLSSRIHPIIFL